MEIENIKATSRAKLWLIRMPLLALLVILVLTLMDVFPSAIWLIISAGLFILTLLTVLLGRLHYVNFSFSKSEIQIRYYHLFPLVTDYQELDIQTSDHPEFEVRYWFFNLVPILYISVSTSQGRAVYPPIPLGLLPASDFTQLLDQLGIK